MSVRRVLVIGGGGAVGLEIVRCLRSRSIDVVATYRTRRAFQIQTLAALGAEAMHWDLSDDDIPEGVFDGVDAAIFTPILTVSAPAAIRVPHHVRMLVFSSNNVGVDPASSVYAALRAAESALCDHRPDALILRPTMIYGHPGDGNLAKLMRAIRRFRIAPMAGRGAGLQQPIFFEDLAAIAADLITAPDWRAGLAVAAGPTPISQRRLYGAVARASGVEAVTVSAPLAPLRAAARMTETIGLRLPLSSAQLARADKDRLPVGERVLLGATALENGLRRLADALDAKPHGAQLFGSISE